MRWLERVDCERDQLFFICTDEAYETDWEGIQRALEPQRQPIRSTHANNRLNARKDNDHLPPALQLSEEEERHVRECMYPLDTLLHAAICDRGRLRSSEFLAQAASQLPQRLRGERQV